MKHYMIGCVAATLLFAGSTHAQTAPKGQAAYACPVLHVPAKQVSDDMVKAVSDDLNKAFFAAIGEQNRHLSQPEVFRRVAAMTIDRQRIAELAEVSGCAALIDEHAACAGYFDPELGSPLSTFMSMKKTAPARRQFERAVAQVRTPELRRAGLACIKLISEP